MGDDEVRRPQISATESSDDARRPRRTVAVFGSCTTRDAFNSRFNPDYKSRYEVRLAANQTSVITMMSPPVDVEITPTRPMTDYDQWNVRSDLSKEFLPLVADLKPDYLLLDFFADIHFGVLRLRDGTYVTNNRWKTWRTDFYERLVESNGFERLRIFDDPDAYFGLWADALDRFATYLAEHCPETEVVVHCGFNTDELIPPGSARPVPLRQFKAGARINVPVANELWARLDDHATSTYGWSAIDLRDEGYLTCADHPWGPFYVHYTPDYYHRFLAELDLIDLRDRLSPDDLALVQGIADAGHEHAVRYARQWTETTRAEEARIRELEGLGVLRAARFALGQRLRQARAGNRAPSLSRRAPRKEER